MGKSVCTVCALLINLSGGGEHFLIIDYHNTPEIGRASCRERV